MQQVYKIAGLVSSSNIPILIQGESGTGNPMEKTSGLIPLSQTIFTDYNLFITMALLIVLPIMTRLMMPKPHEVVAVNPELLAEEEVASTAVPAEKTFAVRMENSRVLSLVIVALGYAYLIYYFATKGFKVDVNTVNLLF